MPLGILERRIRVVEGAPALRDRQRDRAKIQRDDRRVQTSRAASSTASTQALRQMGSAFKPMRLHGRHRSRLHADVDHRGRAGGLPAGPGQPALLAAELRPNDSGARSRSATRSSSRATCRRSSCSDSVGPSRSRLTTRSVSASPAKLTPHFSLRPGRDRDDAARGDIGAPSVFPHQGIRMCALSRCCEWPIARATCSRRTIPSRTTRSAPTRPT